MTAVSDRLDRIAATRTEAAGKYEAAAPIKIGIARDPEDRLRSLQTAHYERLTLLGVVRGTLALEWRLQRKFTESRIRGEWFELTPELDAYTKRRARPLPADLGEWEAA